MSSCQNEGVRHLTVITMNLLKLMFILAVICHSCTSAIQDQETSTPEMNTTVENTEGMESTQIRSQMTHEANRIVTATPKMTQHDHVSVAIIAVATGAVLFIFFLAWCVYARQFPTSSSGQVLVRIKYIMQKAQPEMNAYRSVRNTPDSIGPV